ncbi:MAG: hypothetical protein WBQ95_17320, partial [Terracidiphilus sp.]
MASNGNNHNHMDIGLRTGSANAFASGMREAAWTPERTANGGGSDGSASLKLAGNIDFRFALSRCKNPESPVTVIPSSRTREPMKLNTDCAPKAITVEVAAARKPVSRLIELRIVPWLPPNSQESNRSPAAIKGDEGLGYW